VALAFALATGAAWRVAQRFRPVNRSAIRTWPLAEVPWAAVAGRITR
jgi:hypothetical protein